ncbi:hypothetical protein GUITHDRAFT_150854 [Guillardia theta CCMP2712]|uniref:Uncharacterized protein n=1 Tax=Guillardia theta (strain CCMP2712) TaxID=905079 RepID=L1JUD8_GUITC|nr:hypothetical protein GUITHDRAFT_150854 [Guillardia theta CCMP2712]EKX51924.1 hypothetical protein GUITHDRAFT_150854 [Guillardia theta CCMP2712]|eukprot:XP_005838904.1 hypothetical protein GUITHDRAFT_150854 [Guillardia theta CCMP2712]
MFQTLSYFKIEKAYGGITSCEESPKSLGTNWMEGTCAASGFSHLWSENRKTGLATFKNFKRVGAKWDNSNNAA